jgi:LDH2 family malate/lactate/ureidoglycolate dehydrogenase
MRIEAAHARALASTAFRRAGVAEQAADAAADVLVMTEMMGISTHGLNRVETYCTRIAAGGIDPHAVIEVRTPALALRRVDGRNGLGPVTAIRALAEGQAAARAAGVGAVFVKGATHIGALAPYLWRATQAGFAAIITTATAPMIAPPGGKHALIGNNPIGIGVPIDGHDPVLLDMALSVVARSRVRAAQNAGTPIPAEWALDAHGHPTTDPAEALKGVMQAIGGAKGANLALCLDLLAGGLSGAVTLGKIADQHKTPSRTQGLGLMFLLIDVQAVGDDGASKAALADAAEQIEHSAPADPATPVRLPGARALAQMRFAERQGFEVPPPLLSTLEALAGL